MATQATKLPAAVPTGRAAAAALAVKPAPAPAAGSAGTFKLLVWLLVVLNLIAAGGWIYLKFFKNSDAERSLATNRRRLVRLQTDLDVLNTTVRHIASSGVNEVRDPGSLVGEVAKRLDIDKEIAKGGVKNQRFHRTNYNEKTVQVTFLGKKVYKFGDIVKFLTLLEAANPTVQIKDIDFGKRYPPTIGSDGWIPTVSTVRTLQLESSGGN